MFRGLIQWNYKEMRKSRVQSKKADELTDNKFQNKLVKKLRTEKLEKNIDSTLFYRE